MQLFKSFSLDFPRGTVGGNLPANAGDTRFVLWSRRIPHATEQLSLCATTAEVRAPRARAPQGEATRMRIPPPQQRAATAHPTRESPHTAGKTQPSHK